MNEQALIRQKGHKADLKESIEIVNAKINAVNDNARALNEEFDTKIERVHQQMDFCEK